MFICKCSKQYIFLPDWLSNDSCKDHIYCKRGTDYALEIYIRNNNIYCFLINTKYFRAYNIEIISSEDPFQWHVLNTLPIKISDFESENDYINFLLKYVDNYIFT